MKIPEKYISVVNTIGNILLFVISIHFYITHPEYQQIMLTIIGIALLVVVALTIIFAPITILAILLVVSSKIHDFFNSEEK